MTEGATPYRPEPRRVTLRQFRREQRCFARALALEDALRALSAVTPSMALDSDEMRTAYQEQIARICQWFARCHAGVAARKPQP